MGFTEHPDVPDQPAPHKPKVLPTRTVNRGFIPKRRKKKPAPA